ncbi:MAG: hypothetical protein JNL89_16055 [Rhodanobacteraceae bacterium]|nr:hypothetical protein [Rhodanobacteraceae bacterium]
MSKVCYDHIELEVLRPLGMRAASYRYDAESGAAQGYNDTLAPEIPPTRAIFQPATCAPTTRCRTTQR